MTYCIAVSINEGLVLTSDSRTNAGIDNVSTHGKMHAFATLPDRKIVMLSAGNLATTQAVLEQLHRDIAENSRVNLNSVGYISDAVNYIGQVSLEKQKQFASAFGQSAFNASATFIVAGQIGSESPAAHMVYPEGNNIMTSEHTPFLQIGESKYGKPVLDRIIKMTTPLEEAARCCLVSMDSTIRSNASVGPPVELLIYRKNSFSFQQYYCFEGDDQYMLEIKRAWQAKLQQAFAELPRIENHAIQKQLKLI